MTVSFKILYAIFALQLLVGGSISALLIRGKYIISSLFGMVNKIVHSYKI